MDKTKRSPLTPTIAANEIKKQVDNLHGYFACRQCTEKYLCPRHQRYQTIVFKKGAREINVDTGHWTFGERLHHLRKMKCWTLQQLSDASGVSVQHLCNLEIGHKRSPSLDTLHAIATGFEIPIWILLKGVKPYQEDTV